MPLLILDFQPFRCKGRDFLLCKDWVRVRQRTACDGGDGAGGSGDDGASCCGVAAAAHGDTSSHP